VEGRASGGLPAARGPSTAGETRCARFEAVVRMTARDSDACAGGLLSGPGGDANRRAAARPPRGGLLSVSDKWDGPIKKQTQSVLGLLVARLWDLNCPRIDLDLIPDPLTVV
jgi:hypothetical protein